MLLLGHLGIGQALARPWLRRLPLLPFFVGTLLPDLIDKPLYYGRVALTGRAGIELGLLSGTRTIGHTLLLTLAIAAIGRWRRAPTLLAIALGMLTHQGLDTLCDLIGSVEGPASDQVGIPGYASVFWPLMGSQFPVAQFSHVVDHAEHVFNPVTIAGEVVGGVLLLLSWFQSRRRVPADAHL